MSEQNEPNLALTPEQQARRRLLKLGAYVPPMILGMAIMAQTGLAQARGNRGNGNGGNGGHGGNGGNGGNSNNGNGDRPSCSPNCCAPAGSNANRSGCGGGGGGGGGNGGGGNNGNRGRAVLRSVG